MAYKVLIYEDAQKFINNLDKVNRGRIKDFLIDLAKTDNPRSFGDYKPLIGSNDCRYRVGDYRIICEIEDEIITVFVIRVEHRKKIYKKR